MPRETVVNGRRQLSYSKVECLRGDGGRSLQEFMRDFCGYGLVGLTEAEEREYRNLLERERRGRRATRQAAGRGVQSFDSEGERARLRTEMLKRVR
jgi:hypothetical protein